MVDTSSILETWHRNFPRDVTPGLWARIEKLIDDGDLVAPEEVLVELSKKDDEINAWAKARPQMFLPLDNLQVAQVKSIVNGFPNLLKKGRNSADAFVIALAAVTGCIVITEEAADGSLKKPKIPLICAAIDVRCTNVVGLMRREGWSLH